MDDTTLLKLAGKAAGENYGPDNNPIERDDLALRLAVKLNMDVVFGANYVIVRRSVQTPLVNNVNDPYAATRRAIVLAAAEIGKAMP